MSAIAQRTILSDDSGNTTPRQSNRTAEIAELKARDNHTNVFYIGMVYLVLVATIGITIWSYAAIADAGLSRWYNIPMTVLAVIIIGAVQHQLAASSTKARTTRYSKTGC